jgi:hypothetical protein
LPSRRSVEAIVYDDDVSGRVVECGEHWSSANANLDGFAESEKEPEEALNRDVFELAACEIADARPVGADQVGGEERMPVRNSLHDRGRQCGLDGRIEPEAMAERHAFPKRVGVVGWSGHAAT